MRKRVFKLLIIVISFFIIKDVYAYSLDVYVNDITKNNIYDEYELKIKINFSELYKGHYKIELEQSDNISLIEGDELLISDGIEIDKEKEIVLKYRNDSPGEAFIKFKDISIYTDKEELLPFENEMDFSEKKLYFYTINDLEPNFSTSSVLESNANIDKNIIEEKKEQINNIKEDVESTKAPSIGRNSIKNGILTEEDGTYYYIDGVRQSYFQTIDGKTYYFSVSTKKMLYGLTRINSSYYYFDEEGVMAQDKIIELEGSKYYFNQNGQQSTGFRTIDGKTYYFSISSKKMLYGLTRINVSDYYFDEEGIMAQDKIIELEGSKYYFNQNGQQSTGFRTIDGKTYYFSISSKKMLYGLTRINVSDYYFDENGVMAQDKIVELDGSKYYFNQNGQRTCGFVTKDGKTYYFSVSSKKMLYGLTKIDSYYYYFNEEGSMKKEEWYVIKSDKYYFNNLGRRASGFTKIDEKTYYFSVSSGKMLTGKVFINVNYYLFNDDGVMQTGFQEENGKKYYYSIFDGKMLTGKVFINSDYYYFDKKTGEMQYYFQKIDGYTYYFSIYSGKMLKGKIQINADYYYFDPSTGKMLMGFQNIDGNTYYFSVFNGAMKKGLVLIGQSLYYFNEEGIMQRNVDITIDGVTYHFKEDGKATEGFKTINGKQYYMYANGSFAKGIKKIAGTRYYFDFNTGELLKSNVKHIIDVSTWQGDIDWESLWKSGAIDGAIIRIGYGTTSNDDPVLDNKFERNLSELKRLGIPYGVYLYGYAQSSSAAVKEANFVINKLRQYNSTNMAYPIFYDAEESNYRGFEYTASVYNTTITTFANTLKNAGFNNVGVYGSVSWLDTPGGRLNTPAIRSLPVWVAQYYSICQYEGVYRGWQYTSGGTVIGVGTAVDLSIFI